MDFKFFSWGGQHLLELGPENPQNIVDFTDPGRGTEPRNPPLCTPLCRILPLAHLRLKVSKPSVLDALMNIVTKRRIEKFSHNRRPLKNEESKGLVKGHKNTELKCMIWS